MRDTYAYVLFYSNTDIQLGSHFLSPDLILFSFMYRIKSIDTKFFSLFDLNMPVYLFWPQVYMGVAEWCHHRKCFIENIFGNSFSQKQSMINLGTMENFTGDILCAETHWFLKTTWKRPSWGYLCLCICLKDGLYLQRHPFLWRTEGNFLCYMSFIS